MRKSIDRAKQTVRDNIDKSAEVSERRDRRMAKGCERDCRGKLEGRQQWYQDYAL